MAEYRMRWQKVPDYLNDGPEEEFEWVPVDQSLLSLEMENFMRKVRGKVRTVPHVKRL